MPLLYAIEGIASPYERVSVEPVSKAFAATLSVEMSKAGVAYSGEKDAGDVRGRPRSLRGYARADEKNPSTDRKPALQAHDIMSRTVVAIHESDSMSDANEMMKKRQIRHLPVLNSEGKLVGILSDRDILRVHEPEKARVREEMTHHVLTATPETPLRDIAHAMLSAQIHSMPIVDASFNVVGILTTTDILRAIVKHAPIEMWV